MEKPTSDEKFLAAVAHASVIFSFFGPIGPTLIWAYQRDKSKYVRFHALQAMGYQALAFWVWFIGMFVLAFGIFFLMIIGGFLMERTHSEPGMLPFLLQPIIFLGMFVLMGLFCLIGFIGAVFCMINRDFKYPLIGHWVGKNLFGVQLTEEQVETWEDNLVSGVCHSTAIVQLWGIITPLVVWFSQKERSTRLSFQAMQAAVYQFIASTAYMVGSVAYMVFFFVMMIGMVVFAPTASSTSPTGDLPPVASIIFLIFFGIFMIFWLLIALATPLYFIMAAVASIQTIRGKNFHYPILGRIIFRRMTSKPMEGSVQP